MSSHAACHLADQQGMLKRSQQLLPLQGNCIVKGQALFASLGGRPRR